MWPDDGIVVPRIIVGTSLAFLLVNTSALPDRRFPKESASMPPQPFAQRLDRLEKRMAELDELTLRVDDLGAQFSQFRTEVRGEFSAVRAEMRDLGDTLRAEMRELRDRLRAEMNELGVVLTTRMQVLHEDLIARIAVLGERR